MAFCLYPSRVCPIWTKPAVALTTSGASSGTRWKSQERSAPTRMGAKSSRMIAAVSALCPRLPSPAGCHP